MSKKPEELQTALARRVAELQQALEHVRRLQSILPICMHCHRIRSDDESWHRIEEYLTDYTDVRLSHGICPECLRQHYPETDDDATPNPGDGARPA